MLRFPRLCISIDWFTPPRADLQDPLAREAAVAVAGDGVLDLDHVGTPVGEQRAARGDEDELRELDDANAVEDRHRRRGGTHGLATERCLTCWKARMPSTPRSRPMPLCLWPPDDAYAPV